MLSLVSNQVLFQEKDVCETILPWHMVTNLLLWPENTILNEDSIQTANGFIANNPLFSKLLKLELETFPLVAKIQKNGIQFLTEDWEETVIGNKRLRLERIQQQMVSNPSGATQADLAEYQKLMQFVHCNSDNFRLLYPQASQVGGKWYRTLRGIWTHYATYSGRYNAVHLPMMGLPKELKQFMQPSDPDMTYFSADLRNMELRVAAALTDATSLQSLFHSGEDVHLRNGRKFAQILDLDLDDEVAHKLGKVVAFTLLYGGGPHGIFDAVRETTGMIPDWESPNMLKKAFTESYPELEEILNPSNLDLISTPWGNAPISVKLKRSQRINLPVQLVASIVFKHVMLACAKVPDVDVVLPVHDEVYLKVPKAKLESIESQIEENIVKTIHNCCSNFDTTNVVRFTKLGG